MSEVTITVRGEETVRIAPERATARITLRTEGSERASVVDEVMRSAEPLRDGLSAREDAGTLLDWTSTRLSVRAERPWNSEGRRLAEVFYASIDFTATFAEASELSTWISDVSMQDGVEIGWVNWSLTTETRARIERDVAASAVSVAVVRAHAYAAALGLTTVVPLEIADNGLISSGASTAPPHLMKARGAAFAAESSADAGMAYEPDEIVVSATIEARFIAS